MKAAAFTLERPASLQEALTALRAPGARAMAGGQSLGPMLNLRLARPSRIVSLAGVSELGGASQTADAITLGACVTHAAIADGRTPDLPGTILSRVADAIAYRAVRNRGTIGGSLCHADPAADWPCVLLALGASVIIAGAEGARLVKLVDFITGAFRVALAPGELLRAVRIPHPSEAARFGYYKACRKPGEFAHAMAAVLIDGASHRAVIGAVGGRPIVLEGAGVAPEAVDAALRDSGLDAIGRHLQVVAFHRALDQVGRMTRLGA
jgi:aerobic carbon-monoxide dehydrogenase medium subunit